MQGLYGVIWCLAQTAEQKTMTMVGVGCVAVFFMILCMDKSFASGKQKKLLLGFMFVFLALYFVLYFFAFRKN